LFLLSPGQTVLGKAKVEGRDRMRSESEIFFASRRLPLYCDASRSKAVQKSGDFGMATLPLATELLEGLGRDGYERPAMQEN
jgi:hypothetical protein